MLLPGEEGVKRAAALNPERADESGRGKGMDEDKGDRAEPRIAGPSSFNISIGPGGLFGEARTKPPLWWGGGVEGGSGWIREVALNLPCEV